MHLSVKLLLAISNDESNSQNEIMYSKITISVLIITFDQLRNAEMMTDESGPLSEVRAEWEEEI